MQSALSFGCSKTRELAPFVLVSLLVHLMLLFGVSLPASKRTFTRPHSMTVYFGTPPVSERSGISNEVQAVKIRNLSKLYELSRIQTESRIAHDNVPGTGDTPLASNFRELLDSSKEIARDEARKAEQQIATQEKIRRNTAVGWVEQDIKQPEKEIRLANGMLKIITDWGAVCFQPVPYFARESAGVFGMPITCP